MHFSFPIRCENFIHSPPIFSEVRKFNLKDLLNLVQDIFRIFSKVAKQTDVGREIVGYKQTRQNLITRATLYDCDLQILTLGPTRRRAPTTSGSRLDILSTTRKAATGKGKMRKINCNFISKVFWYSSKRKGYSTLVEQLDLERILNTTIDLWRLKRRTESQGK